MRTRETASIVLVGLILALVSGCGITFSRSAATPTASPSPAPVTIPRPVPEPNYAVQDCGVSGTAKSGKPSNVLLTIDDFPSEHSIASGQKMMQIADWAHASGVMMEAFPIKAKLDAYQQAYHADVVSELRARGTYVSNHSFSHPELTKLSPSKVKAEIQKGVQSTYLRPPYGDFNPAVKKLAEADGYRVCTWTIDTNDWRLVDGKYPSPEELVKRVHTQLRTTPPGSPVVILGHYFTNYPLALQGIVDDVNAFGAHVCSAPSAPVSEAVPFPLC
jgi:hypothetical protein